MKKYMYILLIFVVFQVKANEIEAILKDPQVSNTFKENLKGTYELGANFNVVDYVFTYSCGGGAICGSIYSSSLDKMISFPTAFMVDSFSISFTKNSNKICFSGADAYDSDINYIDKCFYFSEGKLNKSKN